MFTCHNQVSEVFQTLFATLTLLFSSRFVTYCLSFSLTDFKLPTSLLSHESACGDFWWASAIKPRSVAEYWLRGRINRGRHNRPKALICHDNVCVISHATVCSFYLWYAYFCRRDCSHATMWKVSTENCSAVCNGLTATPLTNSEFAILINLFWSSFYFKLFWKVLCHLFFLLFDLFGVFCC